MADAQDSVKFHYVKSPQCRDVHVSGVFGGINRVSGDVHMSVYTERPPIPRTIAHTVGEDGEVGDELVDERETKEGMVRIVQDTLYLDLPTAIALYQWLGSQIERFKELNPGIVMESNDGQ